MIDTLHHPNNMYEANSSVLHQIRQGLGYVAQMGIGMTKIVFEGFSELRDPEIGMLRIHKSEEPVLVHGVDRGSFNGINN